MRAGATAYRDTAERDDSGPSLHAALHLTLNDMPLGREPNFLDMRSQLRSFEGMGGGDYPSVYVDGTHVGDTCILEALDAREVDRVEVYPMGVTNRPGYPGNNAGLILVFLRRT